MNHIVRTAKQLGSVIRRIRRLNNLTQAELGEKSILWQETISKIEGGQNTTKIGTIFDLLAALDLEMEIKPRSRGSAMTIEDAF